jgi:hypothetical protein
MHPQERRMSVVNHVEGGQDLVIVAPDGQRYRCEVSVCHNPVCTCRTVDMKLIPLQVGSGELPTRHLSIDLIERALVTDHKRVSSEEERQFAESLLASLDDDDFTTLAAVHFGLKNRLTEAAGPDEIDAHFDFEEIESNGAMSVYSDVLPFGDRLLVTIDGRQCVIYDHYCLQPKCPCANALLDIVYVDEVARKGKSIGAVWVNYRKRRWKPEDLPVSQDLGTLSTCVERDIPDLYAALQKRHARLREIYASCRNRMYPPQKSVQRVRVGRNDPCPCGSGLKFKKCCLAKMA